MATSTQFAVCTKADTATIHDFLWSIKDDFVASLPDKQTIEEITQLLFDKGGALAGYRDDKMIALLGYFWGEPSKDYRNKDVCFVYIIGLTKSLRRTRIVHEGLRYMIETFRSKGIHNLRFQAAETDQYMNRLYSLIAKPLGKEIHRRGFPCILYEATVDEVAAHLP